MNAQSLSVLQMIAAAGANPVYVTAEQGSELAMLQLIQVDTASIDPTNPNAYRVVMTEAGKQALDNAMAQSVPTPFTPPVAAQPITAPVPQIASAPSAPAGEKPSFALRSGIEIPTIKRGNAANLTPRESIYPFEQMEIGQSFHVPVTADNPKPWTKIASSVSAANARYQVPYVDPATGQQVMEQVTHKTVQKDAAGNKLKGPDGKTLYTSEVKSEPKMVPTRKFVTRQVGANDPDGPGARVFRVAL